MTASEEQPLGQLFVGKGRAKPLPDRRSDPALPENEPFLIFESESGDDEDEQPEVEEGIAAADDPPTKDGSPEQEPLFDALPVSKAPAGSGGPSGSSGQDAADHRAAASLLPLKIHDRKKTKKLEFELTLTDRLPEDPKAEDDPKAETGDLPASSGPSEAKIETTQDSEAVAVAGMAEKPEFGTGEDDRDEEFTMVLPAGAKALARSSRGFPAGDVVSRDVAEESEEPTDDTLSRLPDHPEVTIIKEDRLNRKKAFLAAAMAAVALISALAAYLLWGQSGSERRDLLVAREIVIPEKGSAAQNAEEAAATTTPTEPAASDSSTSAGQDATATAPEADETPGTDDQAGNARNSTALKESESQGVPETSVAGIPEFEPSAANTGPGQPVVDIVSLDADGNVVIAGQAAPEADLIILDNNEPIGTAKADEFGEWVFVASHRLPPGRHEFGLVVKDVKGRVVLGETLVHDIEAPPEPAKDPYADLSGEKPQDVVASEESQDGTAENVSAEVSTEDGTPIPLPKPKPETPAAFLAAEETPAAPQVVDYVIQLASVSSREGAEDEWAKMMEAHKSLLRPLTLIVDSDIFETKFRVRTGPFEKIEEAGEICKALKSRGQDCLVVKRLDGID